PYVGRAERGRGPFVGRVIAVCLARRSATFQHRGVTSTQSTSWRVGFAGFVRVGDAHGAECFAAWMSAGESPIMTDCSVVAAWAVMACRGMYGSGLRRRRYSGVRPEMPEM